MVNSTITILIALAAFLCGGFLTMIAFVTGFVGDIRVLKSDVAAMKKELEDHCKAEPRCCPEHSGLVQTVTQIETRQNMIGGHNGSG